MKILPWVQANLNGRGAQALAPSLARPFPSGAAFEVSCGQFDEPLIGPFHAGVESLFGPSDG